MTHHSKAPKTAAALAAEHTDPKQVLEASQAASAMKPANQKIIVTDSTARMAYLWCARVSEKRHGTMIR